jgi:peptidoglycan/LPS O-acetylase OafA/YrhL
MQRHKYIDLLRLIAIFYMFFFHVVLILLPDAEITGVIRVLFDIVPLDAALFLFLVGFSLTLSLRRHSELTTLQFLKKKLLRGLLLILASAFLFFLQLGLQLPDILISSGILNTIGWLCIIGGLILAAPYRKIILIISIMILCIFTFLCEHYEIFFIPFNWGYEPMSPTILFGLFGLLYGLFYNTDYNEKHVKNIAMIIGVNVLIVLLCSFCLFWQSSLLDVLRDSRYIIQRKFSTAATLPYLFSGASGNLGTFPATIWNYRLPSFLLSLSVVCVMFSGFHFLESFFRKNIPHAVLLPGAHALSSYFYHFIVIAILVYIFGRQSFTLWTVLFLLVLLYAGSYLLSLLITVLKRKRSVVHSA